MSIRRRLASLCSLRVISEFGSLAPHAEAFLVELAKGSHTHTCQKIGQLLSAWRRRFSLLINMVHADNVLGRVAAARVARMVLLHEIITASAHPDDDGAQRGAAQQQQQHWLPAKRATSLTGAAAASTGLITQVVPKPPTRFPASFPASRPAAGARVRSAAPPIFPRTGAAMSTRLRELIKAVRQTKTAADERNVIAKESAALRALFRDQDPSYRHRNVAKLMYIHMLGYPTHFGQMECLKLIASPTYPEKRIGYLALMLLLDERTEVLMLVTNSVKNDLNDKNQYVIGLALCALGNIGSMEMCRDLSPEVERLLRHANPYVRKKAALCALRTIRKVPDMVEQFQDKAGDLLADRHHGVLLAGCTLMLEICEKEPTAAASYARAHTKHLVKILKQLVLSAFSPEHDVGGLNDPYLQCSILRLLRLLGKGSSEASDTMSDILAQVATNTEPTRNAGNAILYECVQTIMGIEATQGLRVLAINILGRFLANRDNNIRYVALNTLSQVVAVDTQAVQRHRNTIVECVKDADVSIRRRALELVYGLINESNIKTLTKELLDYLAVSDNSFKPDLTNKVAQLVQRFAPDRRWYVDNIVALLTQAGKHVKPEIWRSTIVVISNTPELQGYAVRSLFRAITDNLDKAAGSLILVSVWVIGEYCDVLVGGKDALQPGEEPLRVAGKDAVSLMEVLLASHGADP
eukprot:jgi/Tetstr1/462165/TSEL_007230.t1